MKTLQLVLVLVMLSGCAGSLTGRAPETRTLTLSTTPAQAYQQTVATFVAMGATLPPLHAVGQPIQALVHGAVLISVQFRGEEARTIVTVTASIPPGKLVLGSLTELHEFCTRLTTLDMAHGR